MTFLKISSIFVDGLSSADPSSDWNAPAEEWGNWVDEEKVVSVPQPEEALSDVQKVKGDIFPFSSKTLPFPLERVTIKVISHCLYADKSSSILLTCGAGCCYRGKQKPVSSMSDLVSPYCKVLSFIVY